VETCEDVVREDAHGDALARQAVEVGLADGALEADLEQHPAVEVEPEVSALLDPLERLVELEHTAVDGEAMRHLREELAVGVRLGEGFDGVDLVGLEAVDSDDGTQQAEGGGGERRGEHLSVVDALALPIAAGVEARLDRAQRAVRLELALEDPLDLEHAHPLLALDDDPRLVLLHLAVDLVLHRLAHHRPEAEGGEHGLLDGGGERGGARRGGGGAIAMASGRSGPSSSHVSSFSLSSHHLLTTLPKKASATS